MLYELIQIVIVSCFLYELIRDSQSYCAYNCTNRYVKGNNIKLRGFPYNDKLKKWIIANIRDNFTPQKGTKICSEHFFPSDYYPSSRELRKNSVPSVFDFPDYSRKQVKERVPSKRQSVDEIQNDPDDYALPPGLSSQQCKKSQTFFPDERRIERKLRKPPRKYSPFSSKFVERIQKTKHGVKTVFTLPHASSITNWTSSVSRL